MRPNRDRSKDVVLAVTHDQTFANPALKAQTPFVKPPVHVDYGLRVRVGGSTFINRYCYIMDTPCADIVIGEGCNIGPNCSIVGVTRTFLFCLFCICLCCCLWSRAFPPDAAPLHGSFLNLAGAVPVCFLVGRGFGLSGTNQPHCAAGLQEGGAGRADG